jgi:hypothetical protein
MQPMQPQHLPPVSAVPAGTAVVALPLHAAEAAATTAGIRRCSSTQRPALAHKTIENNQTTHLSTAVTPHCCRDQEPDYHAGLLLLQQRPN